MHAQLEATHPIGSPRRTVGWRALVLPAVLALVAPEAVAAPTIAVTAPSTSTLLKVRPTFVVTYAVEPTGAPPLDLASLRVIVNGADWTARFTTGSTQAAYAVAPADSLHAGDWTMEASIADTTGARATTSRTYEVLPTPQTVKPSLAPERTTLLLRMLGAPESASQGFALFPSARGEAAGRVPFDSLDPSTGEASVRVPDGALRGDVFVEVNGKRSLTGVPFVVQGPVPTCGAVRKALPLNDGGWVVDYEDYGWSVYNAPWFDAQRCPDLIPHGCNASDAVARIDASGQAAILVQNYCGVFLQRLIEAVALDKAGREPAVITTEVRAGVPQAQIVVHVGERTFAVPGLVWPTWGLAADFDARGRLLLAVHDSDLHLNLLRLNLPDGDHVPEVLAPQLEPWPAITRPGHPPEPSALVEDLAVRCDGQALVGLMYAGAAPGDYGSALRRVDANSGAVLGDSSILPRMRLTNLAQSCHRDEIWLHGTTDLDGGGRSTAIWRVPLLPDGGVGSFAPRWSMDGQFTRGVSVGSDGGVRAAVHAVGWLSGPFVRLDAVTPCTQAGVTTAAPYCPVQALTVLPARSTRWRPRRATSGAVEVSFHGPRDLVSATMTIVGPDGAPVVGPQLAFERVSAPDVEPAEYRLTWSGPWRVPVAGGGEDFLPMGVYRVRLQGELPDGQSVARSAWYDGFALVEVQAVMLSAAPGAPEWSANPAMGTLPGQDPPQGRPGGGLRIFAEQVTADGPLFDRVRVRVTTTPVLEPDDAIPLERATVRVHLRAFDVDDPMPYLPDLDEDRDATVQDNRGQPATGTLRDAYVDVLPGTDSAETEWTLTHQPGDNFRVVASTSPDWLTSLRAVQPSTGGELSYAGPEVSPMLTVWRTLHIEADSMAPPPTEDMPADTPGYAERNFIKGRVLRISPEGPPVFVTSPPPTIARTPPVGLTLPQPRYVFLEAEETMPPLRLSDGSFEPPGRFQRGRLWLGVWPEELLFDPIEGNGTDPVTGDEFVFAYPLEPVPSILQIPYRAQTATGDVTAEGLVSSWDVATKRFVIDPPIDATYVGGSLKVAGVTWTIAAVSGAQVESTESGLLPFRVYDDDQTWWPFTVNLSLLQDSDDPSRNLLAQAYIRPRYDLPSDGRVAPFVRNITVTDAFPNAAREQLAKGRDATTQDSGTYWIAYLQGAFQFAASEDNDPGVSEESGRGHTPGLSATWGSLILLEAERDLLDEHRECLQDIDAALVVAHEIGHQFGLRHADGRIMSQATCMTFLDFASVSLSAIRSRGGVQ